MRQIVFFLTVAGLAAFPALANEPAKPVTDREITAADVAATPVTDLNLRKDEIPPLLVAAQAQPYDLTGLNRCAKLADAIGELDTILGEDIDIARDERRGPSAGKLAQWVVGTFIPFRGAIRELSGANEQQRRMNVAIQAGLSRRAFLKGVGEAKGCRYPARSAPAELIAAREQERKALADARKAKANGEDKADTQVTLAADGQRNP